MPDSHYPKIAGLTFDEIMALPWPAERRTSIEVSCCISLTPEQIAQAEQDFPGITSADGCADGGRLTLDV